MAVHCNDMDCQKCGEAVKKIRGCEEETEPFLIEGEKYTRCPVKLIKPYTRMLIGIYNNVKTYGVLPNQGGLLNQSCVTIDLLNIMDATLNKKRKSDG